MDQERIQFIKRISLILLAASLVMVSVGIYSIVYPNHSTSSFTLAPGQSHNTSVPGTIAAGDNIEFTASSSGNSTAIVFPEGPDNYTGTPGYLNGSSSYSSTFAASSGGAWYIHVENSGNHSLNVTISTGSASMAVIAVLVLGFTLLPVGGALLFLTFYATYTRKKDYLD